MARYEPDELSATARRWYGSHKGPNTEATIAVRSALEDYYDDCRVLDSIRRLAWGYRWGEHEQLVLVDGELASSTITAAIARSS